MLEIRREAEIDKLRGPRSMRKRRLRFELLGLNFRHVEPVRWLGSIDDSGGEMKLRLTLEEAGRRATRDVQVTVDALATIGDVADGLRQSEDPSAKPATLSVRFPGQLTSQVLSPLLSIVESPVRSGGIVTVVADADRWSVAAAPPVAEAVVVSGPDEGRRFRLAAGVNFIGSDSACQVQLTDQEVSRRHARITVEQMVSIADLNSGNGVRVDGRMIDQAQVTSRSAISVGETVLRVVALNASTTGASRAEIVLPSTSSDDGASGFTRSPRVDPAYRGSERELPELPSVTEKQRFPFLAVISPVLIGAGMFAIIQQPYILLFIALSPVIMLGTWVDSRLTNRRRRRDEHARFTAAMTAVDEEFAAMQAGEVAARAAESPSTGEVIAGLSPA